MMRKTLVSLLVLFCGIASGDVTLHNLFSDNVVLQRGTKLPVWGTADPGEELTVKLGDATATAAAGQDGRWQVRLPAMTAGGPYELTVKGKNVLTVKNVVIGDVWLCSGQSNMAWPVARAANPKQEIAQANYPKIRMFTVAREPALEPQRDVKGRWVVCTPKTVGGFSAVAYFFGRELHKDLDVPIGLINSSWGGTPIESWMSREALTADPAFASIVASITRWEQNFDVAIKQYEAKLKEWQQVYPARKKAWQEAVREARKTGTKPTVERPPRRPVDPRRTPAFTTLYNGMIAPLVPFALKGATWYQGEANAGRAWQYRKLLPAMIRQWRADWDQEFPFLIVQLANWLKRAEQPGESAWAELREAQMLALGEPKTAVAVAIDVGEAQDIHPKNKQEVGRRLALAALAVAYQKKDIVYSGPVYDSMKIEGNKVILSFKHVGGGLKAKEGEPLTAFAIAGKDKKFVWAKAEIEGDKVVVWSDEVQEPVAVRYAWANNPAASLYNEEGLPAPPFRTDEWEGITKPKPAK